jgi:hypothetical protein
MLTILAAREGGLGGKVAAGSGGVAERDGHQAARVAPSPLNVSAFHIV